jgi:hypothetical protein
MNSEEIIQKNEEALIKMRPRTCTVCGHRTAPWVLEDDRVVCKKCSDWKPPYDVPENESQWGRNE